LVKKSGGRPSQLTPRQRKELMQLLQHFDLVAFAKRELKMTAGLKPAKTPSRKAAKA
ncbi:MAG: hypothetical protein JHD16_14690, partial [Solirubrobacteraceae bacterium]|nr:hypothetical protein [Solirubrobacteraceae bacterium]